MSQPNDNVISIVHVRLGGGCIFPWAWLRPANRLCVRWHRENVKGPGHRASVGGALLAPHEHAFLCRSDIWGVRIGPRPAF